MHHRYAHPGAPGVLAAKTESARHIGSNLLNVRPGTGVGTCERLAAVWPAFPSIRGSRAIHSYVCYKVRARRQGWGGRAGARGAWRSTPQTNHNPQLGLFASQKVFAPRGGPDLLKWGLPGGGVKPVKVAPTPVMSRTPGSLRQVLGGEVRRLAGGGECSSLVCRNVSLSSRRVVYRCLRHRLKPESAKVHFLF